MLQSGWILISNGSSTVTSFKPSWQNYVIGCRIQIFTLKVPLLSHGIIICLCSLHDELHQNSQCMRSSCFTLREVANFTQTYGAITRLIFQSKFMYFNAINQGWIFSNFDTKHKQRKLVQFCSLSKQYNMQCNKLLKLCDGHFSMAG